MERSVKYTRKKFIYSFPALVILLFVLVFSVRGVVAMYDRYKQSKLTAFDVERRIKELEDRNAFLAEAIADLKTDEGVERELRGRFNVRRDGEKIAIIINEEDTSVVDTEKSFGESLLLWFKELFK